MADKKTTGQSDVEKTRAEAAEALKRAAELIASLNGSPEPEPAAKPAAAKKPAAKKPATKSAAKPAAKSAAAKSTATEQKPAAKKPAAKSTAAKPATAKSTAAKPAATEQKPAAKKPATKKPAVKKEPIKAEEPVEETEAAEEPQTVEPVAPPPPEPEPIKAPEPEPEPVRPAPAPAPAPAPTTVTRVETTQTVKKTAVVAEKSNQFINNKGKFPLFLIANGLLLLSAILLIVSAFNITTGTATDGSVLTVSYSLFGYLGNSAEVKGYMVDMAGGWANGGYVMIGILMFLAFLAPLALVVKNIVLFFTKQDKNVHALDAIITFAFMLGYLGIVNLYGANMTAGQIMSLIFAVVLLAFTIFVMVIQSRGKFPWYSLANIVLSLVSVFLITATAVYNNDAGSIYAAQAASQSGGSGFAFILLLATVLALVLFVIMQLKKLPGILDIVVPAAAGGCGLIALISMAGGKADQFADFGIGGGFVFGVIFVLLIAVLNILFTVLPVMRPFKVKLIDRTAPAPAPKNEVAATTTTVVTTTTTTVTQDGKTVTTSSSQNSPAATGGKVVCPACGKENDATESYCYNCGRKLK